MKKINFLILMVLVMAIVCGVSYAATMSGTLTLTGVTAATRSTGSVTLNLTYAGAGGILANVTNATLYGRATNTGNSSYVVLATNTSCNFNSTEEEGCNMIFDTSGVEDSTSWSFYVIAHNITAQIDTITSATVSTVIVDNTVPDTPSSLSPSTTQTSRDITFSGTVGGRNTTGCTLTFKDTNPGSTTYSMTHSSNTCTVDLTNIADTIYSYKIVATDGTNSTNSAYQEITVASSSGTGGSAAVAVVGGGGSAVSRGLAAAGEGVGNVGEAIANIGQDIKGFIKAPFGVSSTIVGGGMVAVSLVAIFAFGLAGPVSITIGVIGAVVMFAGYLL